jgi:hypothetical protein
MSQSMRDIPGQIARSWEQVIDTLNQAGGIGLDAGQIREANQAFVDLGRSARVNVDVFAELAGEGVNVTDAMNAAGGAVRFNLDAWEKLVNAGASGQEAFNIVTQTIAKMRRGMVLWSAATAAATVALRVLIRQVQEAFEAYDELSEATRRVRLQTGLLTREASTWVTVLSASGARTATSERALVSFLSKVSDLRREQSAGTEATNRFARALEFLEC